MESTVSASAHALAHHAADSLLAVLNHLRAASPLRLLAVLGSVAFLAKTTSLAWSIAARTRANRALALDGQPLPSPPATLLQRWLWGHATSFREFPSIVAWHRHHTRTLGRVYMTRALLGGRNVTVTDPKALHTILSARSYAFGKTSDARRFIAQITGDMGLLVIDGDVHKRHRRLMNPVFNLSTLKRLVPTMVDSVEELVRLLDARVGEEVDFQKLSTSLTLNVIGRTSFATDFDALNDTESPLTRAYHTLTLASFASAFGILKQILPVFELLPVPANLTYWRAQRTVFSQVESIIASLQERRAAHADANDDPVSPKARSEATSLVSVLLAAGDGTDRALSAVEVRDEMLTFLVAGHETTSNALSMAMYHLARNPAIQDTLAAALRDAFAGMDPADDYSAWIDAVLKHDELARVVNEALRVHSPAYVVSRAALADTPVELADGRTLVLPKGATVLVPIQAIHLDHEIWGDDADTFRPDRWKEIQLAGQDPNPAATRTIMPTQYLPFINGPRACIGRSFAVMELKVFIALLLTRFRVALPEDKHDFVPTIKYGITARPVEVPLVFSRR
ncbi:hypothetical protein H9P43_000535 [Blastocladiella emersonii ATCC 22665]|nr:hypothetical protein H9P43_000535 [Blastocladiella emersonii ATCC 22665]